MQAMISEATKKPDLLVAPAGPAPGSIFDDAYWDYNLTLAWIIYRDITLAESFSEQAPRGFENVLMGAVEGAKGAQAAAKVLLKHLRDGSQRAVSVDQVRGTTIKIKAREWLAVRVFFDGAGLAYLASAARITGRDNKLLRFKKSDAMKLWPPNPALEADIARVTATPNKVPASQSRVESAIKALFQDGGPGGITSKDRNNRIRGWLKKNDLSTVSDRSINRALSGK